MSRNKREGYYAGKFRAKHWRQSGRLFRVREPRSMFAMRECIVGQYA